MRHLLSKILVCFALLTPVAVIGPADVQAEESETHPNARTGSISASGVSHPYGPELTTLPIKGNPKAKITIIEFSDYQCPFCSRAESTIAQILDNYPNDVRLAFVHMPLPFHNNAAAAARAARAAQNQGKFWEMHEKLFNNQRQLDIDSLYQFAEELGLDMVRFDRDMDSDQTDAFIAQGMKDAEKFGISGTPSFLINGTVFVGAQPYEKFEEVIKSEIERADKTAKQTRLSGDKLYQKLVETAPKPAPKPGADDDDDAAAARVFVDVGKSPVLGSNKAPITIVEFTDFECPFCARADGTIKQLMESNPNQIRLVFKHFPLPFHSHAALAHRAAEAAKAQGKFWEMHDMLFNNRTNLEEEDIIGYAETLGLNVEKFTAALNDPSYDKVVEADKKVGTQSGVQGTPHFLINGKRFSGAQPLSSFQSAVDDELKIVKAYAKKGAKSDDIYKNVVAGENKKIKQAAPSVGSAEDEDGVERKEIDIKNAPVLGKAKSPVTMVAFLDFQCPYSARLTETLKQLMDENPGKIQLVFKHFPLDFHKEAALAHRAAEAAKSQKKFWEYYQILYKNQDNLTRDDLIEYARQLKLNVDEFTRDLDNPYFDSQVKADISTGKELALKGTPVIFMNGIEILGAQPLGKFEEMLQAELERAKKPKGKKKTAK